MTFPVSKFEFKYVVMRNNDPNQAIWESNPNHRFDLPEYIKQFSEPATLEQLR
jgi:hypothetical protein